MDAEKLYADCHAVGGMSNYAYEDDPKRLAFTLARYKHVAKMLAGRGNVLEIGCSDGFGSRIVRQHVSHLVAIDGDLTAIQQARRRQSVRWPIQFHVGTFPQMHVAGLLPHGEQYAAAYCLDVLEHIHPDGEFLAHLARLTPVCVIGTPSLESQVYASRLSKEGHVNCYSGDALRMRLQEFWSNVFLFTMNDESLGTGFAPMAHYLLALCVR